MLGTNLTAMRQWGRGQIGTDRSHARWPSWYACAGLFHSTLSAVPYEGWLTLLLSDAGILHYAADVFRLSQGRIASMSNKVRLCKVDGCSEPTYRKSSYCKPHRGEARKAWRSMIEEQEQVRQARYGQFLTLTEISLAEALQAGQGTEDEPHFVRVWPATTSFAHFLYNRQFGKKLPMQSGVLIPLENRESAEVLARLLFKGMADMGQSKTRITFVKASKLTVDPASPVSDLEE